MLRRLGSHPTQTMGVCAILVVVLLVVAAAIGAVWPLTVAAAPLAMLGLTYLAAFGNEDPALHDPVSAGDTSDEADSEH